MGVGVQHFRSLSSRRKICRQLGLLGELLMVGGLWLIGRVGGKVSFLTIASRSNTCHAILLNLGMLLKLHWVNLEICLSFWMERIWGLILINYHGMRHCILLSFLTPIRGLWLWKLRECLLWTSNQQKGIEWRTKRNRNNYCQNVPSEKGPLLTSNFGGKHWIWFFWKHKIPTAKRISQRFHSNFFFGIQVCLFCELCYWRLMKK